ncbi:uncharacterized protein LOC131011352 [Salvia miltiorrhiza]|uniref:uncharacterized protein LOC131011352 n=1 Tax=Salvia miltiorrhiza TaxID=226208 RepID=UPI0025AC38A4|nr:uncharacterized protein LOC131011352 [Salvia miltiorrhiza]
MILQFLNFGGAGRLHFLNLRNPQNAPFSTTTPISCSSSSSIRCVAGNGFPAHDIGAILHNKVLVSAVASAAVGQLTKPFASTILYGKKFDLKTVFSAGGFPSTHSSSVVATATCLGIERGFADALFGLAVVYAGLIMYDAQGVRREVGTHAKLLNKVMPRTRLYTPSSSTDDANDVVNSYSRESSSDLEITDANDVVNSYSRESSSDLEITDPVLSEEYSSLQKSSLLLESDNRMRVRSSRVVSDICAGSESVASSLKESVGHTEIEVAAGAFLGLVVSLVVCPCL